MNTYKLLPKLILILLALAYISVAFLQCTQTEDDTVKSLALSLDDSLALASGKYESIRVQVQTPEKKILRDSLFIGAYVPTRDKARLSKLELNIDVGINFDVVVILYHGGKPVSEIRYLVRDRKQLDNKGEVVVFVNPNDTLSGKDSLPKDSLPKDTSKMEVKPKSIEWLIASPYTLAANDSSQSLRARILPVEAKQDWVITTETPEILEVMPGNRVKGKKIGTGKLLVKCILDPAISAELVVHVIIPIHIDSIRVLPNSLNLFTTENAKLSAKIFANDTTAAIQWQSLNAEIAKVDNNGIVVGLKEGITSVLATAIGDPTIADTSRVTVKVDAPVLTLEDDQNITVGGEARFNLKTTQAFGTIAAIKVDWGNDGTWDDSVTGATSFIAKHTFTQIGSNEVRFLVRDGEGNTVEAKRRVVVGSKAPFVVITSPAVDTLVNVKSLNVRFTVDGVAAESTVVLNEGKNKVLVSKSNSGGTGSDSVTISVDTDVPKVTISSPAQNIWTNQNILTVVWSVNDNGVIQNKQDTETLTSEGGLVIKRSFKDAAGNIGIAEVTVNRDITVPKIKVSYPEDLLEVSAVDFDITGVLENASDIQTVNFKYDNDVYAQAAKAGASWTISKAFSEGVHTVWVRVADKAGNTDSVKVTVAKRPNVVFVKKGSTGDGSSWRNALGELTTALDHPRAKAGNQIWVAKGVYYPLYPGYSFNMKDSVDVLGGFSSSSIDTVSRNFEQNQTVLDGQNKSAHVVNASNQIIDGFVIQHGNASDSLVDSRGSAIFASTKKLTIRNTKISDNYSPGGSAIYQSNEDFNMVNCTVENNKTSSAVYIDGYAHKANYIGDLFRLNIGAYVLTQGPGTRGTMQNSRFENNSVDFLIHGYQLAGPSTTLSTTNTTQDAPSGKVCTYNAACSGLE